MESEVARIIAIIGHLPGALVKLSTVENALACALSGARQQDSTKSVYVCGGIDIEEELLLAITHQGKPCGSGKDGPVTCEANAWQAKVADWPVEQAPDRKSQIRTQWTTAPSVLADACASSITWPGSPPGRAGAATLTGHLTGVASVMTL